MISSWKKTIEREKFAAASLGPGRSEFGTELYDSRDGIATINAAGGEEPDKPPIPLQAGREKGKRGSLF
jgi:hypothetical protein